jgi:NAD(P)-dependent dehydrogenase (short-subunit alcohol dehydrogenase family)
MLYSNNLLEGKKGLIIGGTSGMGLATARQVVAWGGQVIPASSNPEKVKAALTELNQTMELPAITLDVRDKASITEGVGRAAEALGRLDFLGYFAGVLRSAPIERLDEVVLEEALTINAKGALWSAQAAFPFMREQKSGVIIIITSMSAHLAWGGVPSYAISKHATLGVAVNLANEWGRYGIRVIPVAPGVIETDLNRDLLKKNAERTKSFIERTPLGRLGEPHEVGAVVAFLCSDVASYMSGVPVVIDGGMLNRGAFPLDF